MKTSSVHGLSDNKSRPVLNLEDSVYSASMNTQMLASPIATADNFNK